MGITANSRRSCQEMKSFSLTYEVTSASALMSFVPVLMKSRMWPSRGTTEPLAALSLMERGRGSIDEVRPASASSWNETTEQVAPVSGKAWHWWVAEAAEDPINTVSKGVGALPFTTGDWVNGGAGLPGGRRAEPGRSHCASCTDETTACCSSEVGGASVRARPRLWLRPRPKDLGVSAGAERQISLPWRVRPKCPVLPHILQVLSLAGQGLPSMCWLAEQLGHRGFFWTLS